MEGEGAYGEQEKLLRPGDRPALDSSGNTGLKAAKDVPMKKLILLVFGISTRNEALRMTIAELDKIIEKTNSTSCSK